MLIGYLRVSRDDCSDLLISQREALLAVGIELNSIYQDLDSGRYDSCPNLFACLKMLQPGDTLVLWKLDRLARNLSHLIQTAEALRMRDIGLKVLTGVGAKFDTTTIEGRQVFGAFAAFAEVERELVVERTRTRLATARLRGHQVGCRKMDLAMLTIAMAAMPDSNVTSGEVARRLGVTLSTLYFYVNGDGSPKAPGIAILAGASS
jgi:DNA invertase Pin-like site-specific DNA recombinase